MSGGIWVPPGGSADLPPEEPEPEQELSDQELADRFREELKRIKVVDLLVQTLYTVSSLGYHRLGPEARDLPQARLAIETLRALLPVVRGEAPDEVVRDFEQVVANMQLAYADAVKQEQPPEPDRPAEGESAAEEAPAPEDLEPVDEEELGGGG
ncbi:MAG TPA: hypothetical protein VF101_14315 [Gaiellaceae bacterium]